MGFTRCQQDCSIMPHGGDSSFSSCGTFQEHGRKQKACQPRGGSETPLPSALSWSLGLRELLWPLHHSLSTDGGLLSLLASPARPKLALPMCVPGRRATIVSQESIIVLHEPYLIRERKMGLTNCLCRSRGKRMIFGKRPPGPQQCRGNCCS